MIWSARGLIRRIADRTIAARCGSCYCTEGRSLFDVVMPEHRATNAMMLSDFSRCGAGAVRSDAAPDTDRIWRRPKRALQSRDRRGAATPLRSGPAVVTNGLAAGLFVVAEARPVLTLQEVADAFAAPGVLCLSVNWSDLAAAKLRAASALTFQREAIAIFAGG